MPFDVQDDFDDAALWAALDSAPAGPHHPPPVRPPPPARPPPTSAPSGPLSRRSRDTRGTLLPPVGTARPPRPAVAPRWTSAPSPPILVVPIPRSRHPRRAPRPRPNPPRRSPLAPPASVGISVTNYDRVQAGPAPPRPDAFAWSSRSRRRAVASLSCPPPGVYDEALVAACRRIPGAAFDSRQRRWTFPDASLSAAAREFKSARGVVVDLVPPHPIAQRALAAMAQLERAAAIALAERAEAAGDAETGTTKDDRSPGTATRVPPRRGSLRPSRR